MAKRILCIIGLMLLTHTGLYAQFAAFYVSKSEQVSTTVVRLTLTVVAKDKKLVEYEAVCAAIRVVMFSGCPNTKYNKPLLDVGEATAFEQNPEYFNKLYNYRVGDFISSCMPLTKFKGAEGNGTKYEVDVNVLMLRKDLEKNGIRNKLGI